MLDSEIAAQTALLTGKNQNAANAALQALEAESAESDAVYAFFDRFAAMLTAGSGFARARGLRLLAANARWDEERKLDGLLPEYLRHITDPKPIVARQCMAALPAIAAARPDLRPAVRAALETADFSGYAETMAPLLLRDQAEALSRI